MYCDTVNLFNKTPFVVPLLGSKERPKGEDDEEGARVRHLPPFAFVLLVYTNIHKLIWIRSPSVPPVSSSC